MPSVRAPSGGGRNPPLAALIFLILLLTPALSTNQLVSLQGRVLQSGSPAQSGNIAVTVWTAVDNGTLLYSDNFANAINDGFFDLMLGSSSELNLTYGNFYYLDMSINGQDMNWSAPSGSIVNRVEFQSTNGQIPPAQIQYDAINASAIQPDSINATHILGGAITAAKMAFNAINSSHIIDNAITTAKIINDAITSAKIAPGAVNSSHLNSAGTYYLGKLGIGTTSPSADLEIKSSSSVGAINITNGTGYPVFFVNGSTGRVGIGTTGPDATLYVAYPYASTDNTTERYPQIWRSNDGGNQLYMGVTGAAAQANRVWRLQTSMNGVGDAGILALQSGGGNVGIGTASPSKRFQVAGTSYSQPAGLIVDSDLSELSKRQSNLVLYTSNNDGTRVDTYIRNVLVNGAPGNGQAELAFGTTLNISEGATEKMRIRDNGYVGINVTHPDAPLQVIGNWVSDQGTLKLQSADTTSLTGITFHSRTSTVFKGALYYDNSINTMYLRNYGTGTGGNLVINSDGGYVGIGGTPSYQLQLSSDSAAKPSTNTWTISSDSRVKKDVRPFTDGLSVIGKIDPVWYKYNGLGGFVADGKDQIGVIGQEIKEVAPYTVNTYKAKLNENDTNDTELLNFNSHALTFVLINSVKELNSKVEKLEAENLALKQLVCLDHPDAVKACR